MGKKKHSLSDEALSLKYWQAVIAFGNEAVERVVNQPKWAKRYPGIIRSARSEDMRTKNDTVLPGEVIYEIAGREECIYDFLADSGGQRLYTIWRKRKWTEPRAIESKGYTRISNQGALLTYGAYCLFMAADNVYGYKGEPDPRRDRDRTP